MDAVLYAALAALSFGLLAVTLRRALGRGGDPEVGALAAAAVALAVSAVAALPSALGGFDPGELWPFLVGGALAPGASQILLTLAIRAAGIARPAVVMGVTPLISVGIALTLLGEPVKAVLLVGTLLIVSGGVSLAREQGRPGDWRPIGLVLALACAVLFASRDNFFRWGARDVHPPPLVASTTSLLAATSVLLAYLLVARRRTLRARLGPSLRLFAPAGVALAAGYGFLALALNHGRVSVVSPLNQTQSLWAMLFAAMLFGRTERVGRHVVLAGLLIVSGGALIGVFR